MEQRPRRESKDLPPDFSDLMNKLIKAATSFIEQFDNNEPEMREIVTKILTIAEELKEMQETKDWQRPIYGGVGALLTVIGVVAAPFTGGLSLAGTAGAVAGGGAVGVGYINITKQRLEKQRVKQVEDLGEELKKIIEPLKETLDEIKTTCEELEEKSTEAQTENTLRDVEELKKILRRVSELKKKSREAVDVAVGMIQMIKDLLVFIVTVFRVTPSSEQDQKLRGAIIQSADQSQKVINSFENMKEALREFTGN